ncbi:MAG: efflux RND transporter permease subunit [bacterium]|nr:efflux RND transporter permease subunit [bacterium]
MPIHTRKSFVYLKDIAKIQRVPVDDSIKHLGTYQLSGQNYVSLSFNKKPKQNIFSSAKETKKLIDQEMQKMNYEGLHYIITSDLAEMISDDYSALARNGLQTLILVFLALLIFVGFKESVIATLTIPLAFFITFIVLKQLGLSLNFLTNFSLIITFGIAIDTTIVVIEGAYERMRQGFKPKSAILLSVRDYKTPLMAGTATTVVVFLPLLTLPGLMGKFLAYIPITIFVTLIAALLISLTINSALYYKLSKSHRYFEDELIDPQYMKKEDMILLKEERKGKKKKTKISLAIREKLLDRFSDRYARLIAKIMQDSKTRLKAIAWSLGIFIITMLFVSAQIGFKLFPSSDNGQITITTSAKKGTIQEAMQKYGQQIDDILTQIPEINVYSYQINKETITTSVELLKKTERHKKHLRSANNLATDLDLSFDPLRSEGLEVDVSALKS